VKCLSMVARGLVCAWSLVPLLADDNAQLLAEFQKTKPDVSQVHVIAETPLLVGATGMKDWGKNELLGVFARRGEQIVQISVLPNEGDAARVSVDRTSPDSITLGLYDPDVREHFDTIKIFFDPKNFFPRRIVRFSPVRIQRITATGGVITLYGSNDKLEFTAREVNGNWRIATKPVVQPEPSPSLASLAEVTPMPVSTFGDFQAARPKRAKEIPQGGVIEEKPGPFQKVGNKIWVGKTFADSEDSAGVGDIGYFDEGTKDWVFLHLAEMADWSASALLVETQDAWVGLASYSDGATVAGGLLRYEVATKKVTKIDLPEEIVKIVRVGRRLYCGTSGGFAIVEADFRVHRFEFTPELDGEFTITPAI
jgi:hypothetical protein